VRILRRFGLAAAILLFGLTANGHPARADSWKEATAAFAHKEYAKAMKLFKPLAEKGNALAQYNIALMHKMGLGVPKSEKEARKWARLAAKQGHADAQLLMGSLYYKQSGEESPDVPSRLYLVRSVGRAGKFRGQEGSRFAHQGDDAAASRGSPRQGAKMQVVGLRPV
jgi:TPR repeat protein